MSTFRRRLMMAILSVAEYQLTKSEGEFYTTLTVSRTSSPKKGASTGVLSNKAKIYDGDVLLITVNVTPSNVEAELNTFTVNGGAWTSGQSITVSNNVEVYANAKYFKVIWTGSETHTSTKSNKIEYSDILSINSSTYQRPTRISGRGYSQTGHGFNNVVLSSSKQILLYESTGTSYPQYASQPEYNSSTGKYGIKFVLNGVYPTLRGIVLRTVEQKF